MTTVQYTPQLCEELYSIPKFVASSIHWKPGDGPGKYIFQAQILTQDGRGLDLNGVWVRNSKYGVATWGFSLYFFGNLVRSYDMAKKHKNPGGGKVRGPHKHRFTSSKIHRFAYKPDPPISEADPNQALMDFLKESNIEPPSDYQHFLFA
jgi:hypothetical protein